MPEPSQGPREAGVVDVAAGAAQQIAMEDQDADPARLFGRWTRLLCCRRVSEQQKYRLRAPASGREAVAEVEVDGVYIDRETGEEMLPVTRVLPLAPSESALLRTPENLRECGRCKQLIGLDVSDCPYCGQRQGAVDDAP